MRVAILLAVITIFALASGSACEAQRRSPAPFGPRASEAPLLRETAAPPTPEHYQVRGDGVQSWGRHVAVAMAVGGAVGLAWGLTQTGDENVFGLSPVIETVIGIGVGLYAGTAVYLVQSVRR